MKLFRIVLFTLVSAMIFVTSGAVFARANEPIVNVVNEPVVTASGTALTVDDLKQLITNVAQARKWIVTPMQNGNLRASLSWKRHTIVVEIECTPLHYSILYMSSINMNYAAWDEPMIHPYYNRYVKELRDAIRAEMRSL